MSRASDPGLLLDTHVFLWWAAADDRLSDRMRAAIADPGTEVVLSVVSAWEVTIKHGLGRLDLASTPRALVKDQVARHGFRVLDVSLEHALAVGDLPRHHADPFDRPLIAQAGTEDLRVVTADAAFAAYDVTTVA